jgi:hypothetical protein
MLNEAHICAGLQIAYALPQDCNEDAPDLSLQQKQHYMTSEQVPKSDGYSVHQEISYRYNIPISQKPAAGTYHETFQSSSYLQQQFS